MCACVYNVHACVCMFYANHFILQAWRTLFLNLHRKSVCHWYCLHKTKHPHYPEKWHKYTAYFIHEELALPEALVGRLFAGRLSMSLCWDMVLDAWGLSLCVSLWFGSELKNWPLFLRDSVLQVHPPSVWDECDDSVDLLYLQQDYTISCLSFPTQTLVSPGGSFFCHSNLISTISFKGCCSLQFMWQHCHSCLCQNLLFLLPLLLILLYFLTLSPSPPPLCHPPPPENVKACVTWSLGCLIWRQTPVTLLTACSPRH